MRKIIMTFPEASLSLAFAQACVKQSLLRGETPVVLPLLYLQEGILKLEHAAERQWMAEAEAAWGQVAETYVAFYADGTRKEYKPHTTPGLLRTRAVIESPFSGPTPEQTDKHVQYAQAAIRHALEQGYAPIASHLVYTQEGILNDDIPAERTLGIEAGVLWYQQAEVSLVFTDMGISKGMEYGIARAEKEGIPVRYLSLPHFTPKEGIHSIKVAEGKSIISPRFTGL